MIKDLDKLQAQMFCIAFAFYNTVKDDDAGYASFFNQFSNIIKQYYSLLEKLSGD